MKRLWNSMNNRERAKIWNDSKKTQTAFEYLHEIDSIAQRGRNQLHDEVLECLGYLHPEMQPDQELNALLNSCRLQFDFVMVLIARVKKRLAETGQDLERDRRKNRRSED